MTVLVPIPAVGVVDAGSEEVGCQEAAEPGVVIAPAQADEAGPVVEELPAEPRPRFGAGGRVEAEPAVGPEPEPSRDLARRVGEQSRHSEEVVVREHAAAVAQRQDAPAVE